MVDNKTWKPFLGLCKNLKLFSRKLEEKKNSCGWWENFKCFSSWCLEKDFYGWLRKLENIQIQTWRKRFLWLVRKLLIFQLQTCKKKRLSLVDEKTRNGSAPDLFKKKNFLWLMRKLEIVQLLRWRKIFRDWWGVKLEWFSGELVKKRLPLLVKKTWNSSFRWKLVERDCLRSMKKLGIFQPQTCKNISVIDEKTWNDSAANREKKDCLRLMKKLWTVYLLTCRKKPFPDRCEKFEMLPLPTRKINFFTDVNIWNYSAAKLYETAFLRWRESFKWFSDKHVEKDILWLIRKFEIIQQKNVLCLMRKLEMLPLPTRKIYSFTDVKIWSHSAADV